MAFRTLIIAGLLYILHSCAQVGTLTGGSKDETAPKPVDHKMEPRNGSTNFHGSEIKIPFDEFVTLDTPSETMVMIPPHAKLKAKIHGKTVFINWTDTLQENTTYIIYLNGTVKDVTERNDSLMQIVFSTGNILDSLSYELSVINAFSGEPAKNCLVGLYAGSSDSIKPTYFVKTNLEGKAKFSYLKQGKYTVLCFDDKNKDLLLQPDENLAFKKEVMQLDSSVVDSVPLRLFVPKAKERIRTFSYKAPGMFTVSATASLKNARITVNNLPLEKNNTEFITEDSLRFLMEPADSGEIEIIVSTDSFSDTASIRVLEKEKKGKLTFWKNLKSEYLSPNDTLVVSFTDKITSIDTSLFRLVNKEDSSLVSIKKITFNKNNLVVSFDRQHLKTVDFTVFPKGVKTTLSELSDTLKISTKLTTVEEFGSIKLDVSDYREAIIVDVIMNGSVVRSLPIQDKKIVLLEYLLPNNYTFRIIRDENSNGRWDTGDRSSQTFPEEINTFSEITKVRANWEIDVKLTKNP